MIEAVSGSKGVPDDWIVGLKETICPAIAGAIRVGMAQWIMTSQNEAVWKKAHCGQGMEPPYGGKGS